MSTVKVEEIQHPSNSNNAVSVASDSSVSLKHSGSEKLTTTATGVNVTGTCTATTFSGSGASLTSIPAANLTGTLPAIDGSNLTGISSGVTVQDEGSALSTAGTTLNFVGAGVTASGTGASKTITVPGGGGALEFVSKTAITVSNATTQINFTGLDQGFVYKIVCAVANMSSGGEQRIYLYLNGSSSINTSGIIDYVGADPGSTQRWTDGNDYIKVYTYGYEQYNWEWTMDFYTGTYGWFRGTGHPNGGSNYQAGWGNFWGHLDPSNYASKYISGISIQQNGVYFQNGSKYILYKYKES
ncbi:MAG: hypothetical protein CMF91_00345 [Candidatus Marinimicrobia bacterium]|nr:hypothetical protein [Candidatus Neomarinimicrobiota bacterium]|tara:strand:- start:501 stop:1397 length:897 start_codon:yes stop_codon:yes gene_type:complete